MPVKSLLNGFELVDIQLSEIKRLPDISDDITQTLDRLMAWYDAQGIWKRLQTDQNGRLLVSLSSSPTSQAVASQTPVAAVAARILQQNFSRRAYLIKNTGVDKLWIGFNNAVTSATGFILNQGDFLSDDIYVGEVWGISGGTGTIASAIEE